MQLNETKFSIPQPTKDILFRPQVHSKLDKGLKSKLTLITAPPGYGKTVMMSQWILSRKMPTAWITLDLEDNQWLRFWHHFIEAIKKNTTIFDNRNVQLEELMAELFKGFNKLVEPFIIVLDNFETIQNEAILKWTSWLLNHLPSHVHLYIICHGKPKLRLAKIHLNGEVNELNITDFNFNEYEIDLLCNKILSVPLSVDEVAILLKRTEGWIVGIKLMILIIQEDASVSLSLEDISGAHPKIATYFGEEVYGLQSEQLQQFLLRTSLLDFLDKPICAAIGEREEKEPLLQTTIDKDLFIVPMDVTRKQYRYHVLFKEYLYNLLEERTSPNHMSQMHFQIGKTLEAHHYYEASINHYIYHNQFEKVLYLLEKVLPNYLEKEKTSLWRWTNQIPKQILLKKPKLYLLNLFLLILEGKRQEAIEDNLLAERYLLEEKLAKEERTVLQSGLLYLKAFNGYIDKDTDVAIAYSKKYLDENPTGEFIVGFNMEQSCYYPARQELIANGNLLEAEELLKDLLAIWAPTKNIYFYAHLCIDYGKLLYEWNRLDEAEEYLLEAIKIGHKLANLSLQSMAELLFVKVQIAANQSDKADYFLDRLNNLVRREGRGKLKDQVAFILMQQKWKQRKIILKSTSPLISSLQDEDSYPQIMFAASMLRVDLLIEEGKLKDAEARLARLQWVYRLEEQEGNLIKVLLKQSLLFIRQGNQVQSYYSLEEALDIAQKEMYIRTFLDIGEPMAELLNLYLTIRDKRTFNQKRKVSIDYVKFLLLLFPFEKQDEIKPRSQQRKSVLTPREIDVLELIGQGLSNKEIAAYLDLSIATIKTHINNIYRKLQVRSRLQAVQQANTLGILNFQESEEQ